MKWEWVRLTETTSTQEEARRIVEKDPGHRRVFIAERQVAGRGRRGNIWESPSGGLWCTLTYPISSTPDPFLNLIMGLAVQKGISQHLPPAPAISLKWPNDLMIHDKKWGGILSEVILTSREPEVLMGVGLNLQISAEELQKHAQIPQNATSILAEFGQSPSPEEALESILNEFDKTIEEDCAPGGRSHSQLRVASILDTIGRRISWFDLEGNSRQGEAVSLTEDGALVVETGPSAENNRIELRSAEIHHVRDIRDEGDFAEE